MRNLHREASRQAVVEDGDVGFADGEKSVETPAWKLSGRRKGGGVVHRLSRALDVFCGRRNDDFPIKSVAAVRGGLNGDATRDRGCGPAGGGVFARLKELSCQLKSLETHGQGIGEAVNAMEVAFPPPDITDDCAGVAVIAHEGESVGEGVKGLLREGSGSFVDGTLTWKGLMRLRRTKIFCAPPMSPARARR